MLEALAGEGLRPQTIYMDLGISSHQLDTWERGFSYSYDAPLDMRMDSSQGLSALEVVNEWPAARLETVLRELGEERHARAIAAEVARRRPLETTGELVEAIRSAVPSAYRFGRGHPAKRSFQAIRIAVNDELDSLDRALPGAWSLLADGGRFAAIAFHSLEDRRVKRFLAGLARGCICPPEFPVCVCGHEPEAELLSRRVVRPGEREAETQSPLALSAPAGGSQARRRNCPRRGRRDAEVGDGSDRDSPRPPPRVAPRPASRPARRRPSGARPRGARPRSRASSRLPSGAPRTRSVTWPTRDWSSA